METGSVTPEKPASRLLPYKGMRPRQDGRMFEELEDYRFGIRHAQRSAHAKPMFSVLYSPDRGRSWHPAYGVDLSPGGFKAIGRGQIPDGEIPVKLSLGDKVIDVRAKAAWHMPTTSKSAALQEYGMEILTLGTAGRDTIEKWLEAESVHDAEEQPDPQTIPVAPGEVERLIPVDFRRNLMHALVRAGRLAPAPNGKYPTLGFEYGGVSDYKGAQMHNFVVHSRVIRGNEVYEYTTRVLVDESGTNVIFEPLIRAA